MNFAEVIVFDVLDKRGYKSPSLLRSTNLCRWYLVRKGEELFEIEAYDSQSYGNETLNDYLKSLNALPAENKFIRKPVEQIIERKISCVVRKYEEGEPIYTYFIRPGELPESEASVKVKAFERIHDYLKKNNTGNLAPLSLMFFLSEKGDVFLDGLKCGPWVKSYENLTVISNYLNPELSWEKQLNFFRNSFALKVFTGDPKTEKYEADHSMAVNTFLMGILESKDSFDEKLSSLEKKYRPKQKGFLLRTVLLSSIFILPLLAYLLRIAQSDSAWMGAAFTDQEEKKEEVLERDEFAFEPEAEQDIKVSHQFLQRSLRINEMMLAGNFAQALAEITELSSINLRQGEVDILNEIRSKYPELRQEDFDKAISKSKTLITAQKYKDAVFILQDIVDRYKRGKDVDQALSAIEKIEDLDVSQKAREKEDMEQRAASIEKDRLMVKKLDQLQKAAFRRPVRELDALNRRLDLLKIECTTKAAIYLIESAMKMNAAEKRLFEQLQQFDGEDEKKSRLKLLVDNIAGLGGLEAYDISEIGVEFRDAAGGGNFKFSNMPPQSLYKVFKETSKVDVERAAYYLYLYCLKYGLHEKAKVEFESIRNKELLKEADSLRDMEEARSDLFANK